jgi:flagellar biosynthetic protein FliR
MIFGDMLILALKLAIPVFAIELLSEAGMGVLMRIVPQINVFVAGLQVKLVIGILIIALALPAASRLMDATLTQMFGRMQESLSVLFSGT